MFTKGFNVSVTMPSNPWESDKQHLPHWWQRVETSAQRKLPRHHEMKILNRTHDNLAFRWYILRREGRATLHNVIYDAHHKPMRY